MSQRRLVGATVVLALAVLACAGMVLAQERGGPPGRPMGRGRFDPERFQQMMMERMREALGAGEEEWEVIGPRLEKVMALQRATRPGRAAMGMMFGGRRGRPGGGAEERARPEEAEEEQTPLQEASDDLQTALADESTPPAQVQQKLTAYRAAREQALQELDRAQEKLREVLSVRQEARLVLMGMLD
ncbi:MAG: hypothetical protein PVJ27_04230 [Candidatus Brocadiaceae bacterium]|jgi:hypothetical protein